MAYFYWGKIISLGGMGHCKLRPDVMVKPPLRLGLQWGLVLVSKSEQKNWVKTAFLTRTPSFLLVVHVFSHCTSGRCVYRPGLLYTLRLAPLVQPS